MKIIVSKQADEHLHEVADYIRLRFGYKANGVIHIADFWDVRREPSALAEQVK